MPSVADTELPRPLRPDGLCPRAVNQKNTSVIRPRSAKVEADATLCVLSPGFASKSRKTDLHDSVAFFCGGDRCARLDVVDTAFYTGDTDPPVRPEDGKNVYRTRGAVNASYNGPVSFGVDQTFP